MKRSSSKKRLVLVSKRETLFKVGDVVDVKLGGAFVRATVIEVRGSLGPSTQVVRVEVTDSESTVEPERFEVPATVLQLKSPGAGHGGSVDIDLARQMAERNAQTWVLSELDSEEKPQFERAFEGIAELERELKLRGLSPTQRKALYRGDAVLLGS